jgi:hypothetical protein
LFDWSTGNICFIFERIKIARKVPFQNKKIIFTKRIETRKLLRRRLREHDFWNFITAQLLGNFAEEGNSKFFSSTR